MILNPARERNFDEASVPCYELPSLLTTSSGHTVRDPNTWEHIRRTELLKLFRTYIYGAPPPRLPFHAVRREKGPAFDGLAIREQISLCFGGELRIDLLIYRPTKTVAPPPLFLGLNYYGNHSTTCDPLVREETTARCRKTRGEASSRWPFRELLELGFAVATFCYEDIVSDTPSLWRSRFPQLVNREGQGHPGDTEAGAIAWWAWGTSRAMDYFQEHPQTFNADCIMLVGQSRHGKAALWAGAEDRRFAAIFANCSGCTGAALAKRKYGETVAIINEARPHWLCGNYKQFNNREEALPVDQHQLLALIAPRPLYIASAKEDLSADPLGEYLAAFHAQDAYSLFGHTPALPKTPPQADLSVGYPIGYHIRSGKHDITGADWLHFAQFAKRSLDARKHTIS